jgi:hypothetical protein
MDVTREGERGGNRNRSNVNLRYKFLRGARPRVERQNAAAISRDFGGILIDIWRLEIDASD